MPPGKPAVPSTPWRFPVSDLVHDLGRGAAGTVLSRAVLARSTGEWESVHCAAQSMARHPASADPATAGLYQGAPAVAYALHTAAHPAYHSALQHLDNTLAALIRLRLASALRRMNSRRPPRLREYDLISGFTGLGAYLLHRGTRPVLLTEILGYLVRLLEEPVLVQGHKLPGWWTEDGPRGLPDPAWPTGHGNFGMAHGVAGPLALLALCIRAHHAVPGQHEAMQKACTLLEQWGRPLASGGIAWPERVTLETWLEGPPFHATPVRPSWCYGTPGIGRSLQLAALACDNPGARQHAESALATLATDPRQLAHLRDASVCHGWAGLVLSLARASADAAPDTALRSQYPVLREHLTRHAAGSPLTGAGLLTGTDGVALALHTLGPTEPVGPRWDTCLLLN